MITVTQAYRLTQNAAKLLPVERVSLKQAQGRILRENITSDRPQPAFDKAVMDGIAFSFALFQRGVREFPIESIIAAGQPSVLKNKKAAVKIMTGAVVPAGCDCVVPIEYVDIKAGIARVNAAVINKGQFIRRKGSDASKGEVVLSSGALLTPPCIGIAASVGKTHVKVAARARIAVIATGDELVEIGKPLKAYQTRLSNSYSLQALLAGSGLAQVDLFHIKDDVKTLTSQLRRLLKTHDMLVLSGGVSAGDFDYVPQILTKLGVRRIFHQVAQKPGRPLWFGKSAAGKIVFGLPGNPVSTLVCAYRYVVPFLQKAAGYASPQRSLAFKQKLNFKSTFMQFCIVKGAQLIPTGGSGDFSALAKGDGFIEYDPKHKSDIRPYFSWRP